jgi:hypothetical protein
VRRLDALLLIAYAVLVASAVTPVRAVADTTAYKCVAANGAVTYQGTPCAHGQRQETIQLTDDAGAVSSPAPSSSVADTTPPVAIAPAAPAPKPPSAPLPQLYRCTRATDGKPYISSNGNPQPYYAPLAMTGIVPTPIGQNYGGRVSPNAAMIASHYTQVQDQCQAMTPGDTCNTLRDEYDENEKKLSRAFKSDQPPLLQRESELLAQLQRC